MLSTYTNVLKPTGYVMHCRCKKRFINRPEKVLNVKYESRHKCSRIISQKLVAVTFLFAAGHTSSKFVKRTFLTQNLLIFKY